mmetsp:Transcript_108664/g.187985  ORF Transcript_108664/g.187985 Transcript_108664/m.187985 type:complete len:232 (+) Transcript_108664:1285-1980(+)
MRPSISAISLPMLAKFVSCWSIDSFFSSTFLCDRSTSPSAVVSCCCKSFNSRSVSPFANSAVYSFSVKRRCSLVLFSQSASSAVFSFPACANWALSSASFCFRDVIYWPIFVSSAALLHGCGGSLSITRLKPSSKPSASCIQRSWKVSASLMAFCASSNFFRMLTSSLKTFSTCRICSLRLLMSFTLACKSVSCFFSRSFVCSSSFLRLSETSFCLASSSSFDSTFFFSEP